MQIVVCYDPARLKRFLEHLTTDEGMVCQYRLSDTKMAKLLSPKSKQHIQLTT